MTINGWREEPIGDSIEHVRVFDCGAKAIVIASANPHAEADAEVYRVRGGRRNTLLNVEGYPSLEAAKAACAAVVAENPVGPAELTLAAACESIAKGERDRPAIVRVPAAEVEQMIRELLAGYTADIAFVPAADLGFTILLGGAELGEAAPPPAVVEQARTIPQAVELAAEAADREQDAIEALEDEQQTAADPGDDEPLAEVSPLARKLLQQGRGSLHKILRAGYHYQVVDEQERPVRKDDPRYESARERCKRKWRHQNGLCKSCNSPRREGKFNCPRCAEDIAERDNRFTKEQLAAIPPPPTERTPPGEISAHAKTMLDLGEGSLKGFGHLGMIQYEVLDAKGNPVAEDDPGYKTARQLSYLRWRNFNGLCQGCNNPARPGKTLCAACAGVEEKPATAETPVTPPPPPPPPPVSPSQDARPEEVAGRLAAGWRPKPNVDYEVRDKHGKQLFKDDEGYTRARANSKSRWKKENGICRDCNSPATPGKVKCRGCQDKANATNLASTARKTNGAAAAEQQPAEALAPRPPRLRIAAPENTPS